MSPARFRRSRSWATDTLDASRSRFFGLSVYVQYPASGWPLRQVPFLGIACMRLALSLVCPTRDSELSLPDGLESRQPRSEQARRPYLKPLIRTVPPFWLG